MPHDRDDDDPVFCAVTGRQIDPDGKVIPFPRAKMPPQAPSDERGTSDPLPNAKTAEIDADDDDI